MVPTNINSKARRSDAFSWEDITDFRDDIPEALLWKPAKGITHFYGNDRSSLICEGKIAMYERAAQLQQFLITWVLVADSRQAQIYEYHKSTQEIPLAGANKHHYTSERSDHELAPVPNGALEAESIDDYQIGRDQRGTASSDNSPVHNAYAPHGDITEELKRRFAKAIAGKLHRACMENFFDRLVLVAPAKMIGELVEQLTTDVQDSLVAVLSKDLAHYQGHNGMAHIRDALAEAHIR